MDFECPYCYEWVPEDKFRNHMAFSHDIVEQTNEDLEKRFAYISKIRKRLKKDDPET